MRVHRLNKIALITGITGQDGIYLAGLLLAKGYEVHGIVRRVAYRAVTRLEHLAHYEGSRFFLHYADITDSLAVMRLLQHIMPDEIYHLAAQSDVGVSFVTPHETLQVNSVGTLNVLEAIRVLGMTHSVRFYQASSSEMFGKVTQVPQSETTPFYPRSPYAISKVAAYWLAVNYREAYGMFVCNGILFNHESPLRGAQFVTQKIVHSFARYNAGTAEPLRLGNLAAQRDWGYAPEYVDAMWRMLQRDTPDDYVIATGRSETVRRFVEYTAVCAGVDLVWQGEGLNEVGIDAQSGNICVAIDSRYFRPTEVDILCGNAQKAAVHLGWVAQTDLEQLVHCMFAAAMVAAKSDYTRPSLRSEYVYEANE